MMLELIGDDSRVECRLCDTSWRQCEVENERRTVGTVDLAPARHL